LRRRRHIIVLVLLVGCSRPKPRAAECTSAGDDPDGEALRLASQISDGKGTSAERADSVHRLACLARMAKYRHPTHPVARVLGDLVTVGVAETYFSQTDALLSKTSYLAAVRAVGSAYCDPAPALRQAATEEIAEPGEEQAAAVLERALTCEDPSRAVAALDEIEARALAGLKSSWSRPRQPDSLDAMLDQLAHAKKDLPGEDADPAATLERMRAEHDDAARRRAAPIYLSLVDEAARTDRAKVKQRAEKARADLAEAAYRAALVWFHSNDPADLRLTPDRTEDPLIGPAVQRALPALRERLLDLHPAIRLTAARSLFLVEGASQSTAATRAAQLWIGLRLPQPAPDPSTREELRALTDRRAPSWELSKVLARLARSGPVAAPALEAIRACLAVDGAEAAAAAALALVGNDRRGLQLLRAALRNGITDDPQLVAAAILFVAPDVKAAREALALRTGPLLTAVTERAIEGDESLDWLIRLLLWRDSQ
jgi:hypothetical protein